MHLKSTLLEVVSKEQLCSLRGREICDVVGISQEAMHTSRQKKFQPSLSNWTSLRNIKENTTFT
jgi:hypothetical protein